jgi:hypothetical protein
MPLWNGRDIHSRRSVACTFHGQAAAGFGMVLLDELASHPSDGLA